MNCDTTLITGGPAVGARLLAETVPVLRPLHATRSPPRREYQGGDSAMAFERA